MAQRPRWFALAATAAVAAVALLLGSCRGEPAGGTLERIQKRGVITWGADIQGGEPYLWEDPADPSKIVGFEVDIMEALARRLGVKQRFVQHNWSNLVPSLERGDTAGAWLITNNYLGHPVGMSTHDPWGEGADAAWQPGVVYNIEPVVDLPERGWHFRIEDTIVVTANGVEVLTRAAPTAVTDLVRLREEPGIYERLVSPTGGH